MNRRHAAALALVGVGLAVVILIVALMPRYYLVISLQATMVQLGPFATQTGCEDARHKVPDVILGDRIVDEKNRSRLSGFMVCVATR